MAPRVRAFGGHAASFAVGIGCAILALLPWALSGLRLPLQNLWATESTADRMPLVLLPFSQYQPSLIAALLITGSVSAGLVYRFTRQRLPWMRIFPVLLGVAIVQILAVAQTTLAVRSGLSERSESTFYLTALAVGSSLMVLVGLAGGWLFARGPVPVASVIAVLAVVPFGQWVDALIVPVGSVRDAAEPTLTLLFFASWVPGILAGLALGWCGLRPAVRILAWILSLLVLWIVPAVTTAAVTALGARVMARYPAEMLDYGFAVFRSVLSGAGGWPPTLVIALILGLVLVAVRLLLARRFRDQSVSI